LENEVFEKDFKHDKDALGPKRFEHLKKEEVQSMTIALRSWIIQVLSSNDPNYNTICQKADWFDGQLNLLKPEPRQLIQGINKDMLDGIILHFLPVDANVILLDRRNPVGEGSYGKIFKSHILRVDFIPRHEIYVCKVFKNYDEGDATTSRNKEAISCSLSHSIIVKIFAIHPTKPHGYM
jgi:hypothetical protein